MKEEVISSSYQVKTYKVDNQLSLSMAFETARNGKKGNGGLRLYQYSSRQALEKEALTLAKHMTQKHNIYDTGFTGVKLVANGDVTESNKVKLLNFVGNQLNQMNGQIYTGCDMNIDDMDMHYLSKTTPYILNAMEAPQINTSIATAYGVYGSLKAVLEQDNMSSSRMTFLINGIGKIGSVLAAELVKAGHIVFTYDLNSTNAEVPGAINISDYREWYSLKCDYLLLCSASDVITLDNVEQLNCRWIISSANSPFACDEVVAHINKKKINWVPDVISNAGAVLCDVIEFNEPDRYRKISSKLMYDCVMRRIYHKTQEFITLCFQHGLEPNKTLDIFLRMAQQEQLLPLAA